MTRNNTPKFPKIAVTGGYASGKSTVMKRFSERGYATVSADEIYNGLLENEIFVKEVSAVVGVPPVISDGKAAIDREKISLCVFSDKQKLAELNKFTHSRVYAEMDAIYNASLGRKIVFEIPLLFESNRQNDFDFVIVVMRRLSERISDGARRDGISENAAMARIANQVNYNKIDRKAYTYLYNDSTVDKLYAEVDKIIEKIEASIS